MVARETIPNLLTFARVASVPIALVLITCVTMHATALLVLFLAAALTDYYDGKLAREWNVVSPIGALLDPIADKMLVALLLVYGLSYCGLPLVPVVLILLRELYISGLREYLAARQVALPVSKGGKWKTAAQMTGIGLMLSAPVLGLELFGRLGEYCIWVAALLALISAWNYTRKSWPHLF